MLGDGKTQTRAASAAIARVFHAVERLHHLRQFGFGDARAAIHDGDRQLSLVRCDPHLGTPSEFQGVVGQVHQHPAQRVRTGLDDYITFSDQLYFFAHVLIVEHQALEERIHVGAPTFFGRAMDAAGVGHTFAHQVFHFAEVVAQFFLLC